MSPEPMADLKDDLKELKQAKMAVGLVLILLRRLGLGSAVGAALKRYLSLESAVGGALSFSLFKFRPDLLPNFTELSSIGAGMVLGAFFAHLLGWLTQGFKPLRFYGTVLEVRILHSLGEIPTNLFREIRDKAIRGYFLEDSPPATAAAPETRAAPQPALPATRQVVTPTQPQVVPLPQADISQN